MLKADPSANVTLRRSGGGAFEIRVDGRLRFSKLAADRFPTASEIVAVLA